jgi:hypothetical protein
MTTLLTTLARRRIFGVGALGGALALAACDNLLVAKDPDIIESASSAAGAVALKNGVIVRFQTFTSGQQGADAIFQFGGLLADEWRSGDTFEQRNTVDARSTNITNSFLASPFRNMQRTRNDGRRAITALRTFSPVPGTNVALMFLLTAFAENQMGETYCNGIPFSDLTADGTDIIYGNPVTIDSAFKRATNDADSALASNTGVASEVTRMANFAALIKARALLNRGLFAQAAAAVTAVPTSYVYQATYSIATLDNQNWSLNVNGKRYVITDVEGGTGMPFRSANDPRLPTGSGTIAFDGNTPYFFTTLWARSDPVTVASGIEARLIEAEAALNAAAPDVATYLAKMNEARATKAGLAPLTDPGTQTARVDLLFRERAFWMFGTGHRLGDLRRLIRQYGRGSETVFPTGIFFKGGTYGTDVNLPISIDELNNPNIPQNPTTISQSTCINRNA